MKPPEGSYRELMGIPSADVLATQGHTVRKPAPQLVADDETPHPTAPGRDTKGRVMPAPAPHETCPTCGGSGRLTAAQRDNMAASTFGVPSKAPGPGSYPMPDKGHAQEALSLEHNAPPSERPGITAKARQVLGK